MAACAVGVGPAAEAGESEQKGPCQGSGQTHKQRTSSHAAAAGDGGARYRSNNKERRHDGGALLLHDPCARPSPARPRLPLLGLCWYGTWASWKERWRSGSCRRRAPLAAPPPVVDVGGAPGRRLLLGMKSEAKRGRVSLLPTHALAAAPFQLQTAEVCVSVGPWRRLPAHPTIPTGERRCVCWEG
jgi:hypothetical protein